MKLSEWIRAESYPCGDPDWMPKIEKLEAENAALKRGIAEHAEYDWEGNPINWCAALLTAEEQEK